MDIIEAIEVSDLPAFEDVRCIKGEELINQSYSSYLVDESKISGGHAEYLFFPKTEGELITIIKKLAEDKIPFTISGGRTGIVGSAVPTCGGAVIAMDELKSVKGLGFDEEKKKWFVRVEPGMTLEELKTVLRYKKFEDNHSLSKEKNLVEEFKKDGKNYFFPVNPTEQSASIGGSIAANASGSRTFKYGAMREWVKRLRVILPTGDVLDIPRGKYFANGYKFTIKLPSREIMIDIPKYKMPKGKNAAGYYAKENMDIIDLFIGSEGTLGVISEVELWIEEQPEILENILFFDEEENALDFVIKLRSQNVFKPEFIEFMDANALQLLRENAKKYTGVVDLTKIPENAKAAISFGFELSDETLEQNFEVLEQLGTECSTSLDNGWCAENENEREMFARLRHAVPEIVNSIIAKRKAEYPEIHKLGTDMSVSDEHLKDIMHFYHQKLAEHNLEYAIWGHIGDNHVHVNILPRNPEELKTGKELYKQFAKKAVEYGGSVSAEHGVGKIKKEFLYIMYGEEGVKEMSAVKKAIDPMGLLNRDNIVPYPYI